MLRPAEMEWVQPRSDGEIPTPRSGHSLTVSSKETSIEPLDGERGVFARSDARSEVRGEFYLGMSELIKRSLAFEMCPAVLLLPFLTTELP